MSRPKIILFLFVYVIGAGAVYFLRVKSIQHGFNIGDLLDFLSITFATSGSAFIGYGTLVSGKEYLELLSAKGKIVKGIAEVRINYATDSVNNLAVAIGANNVSNQVAHLNNLAGHMTEVHNDLKELSEKFDELATAQIEMAREASSWFKLGGVVVAGGAVCAFAKLLVYS